MASTLKVGDLVRHASWHTHGRIVAERSPKQMLYSGCSQWIILMEAGNIVSLDSSGLQVVPGPPESIEEIADVSKALREEIDSLKFERGYYQNETCRLRNFIEHMRREFQDVVDRMGQRETQERETEA